MRRRLKNEGKTNSEIREMIELYKRRLERWSRLGESTFIEHSHRPEQIVSMIGNPERVTICTLKGRLMWNNKPIKIREVFIDDKNNIIMGIFEEETAIKITAQGSTLLGGR